MPKKKVPKKTTSPYVSVRKSKIHGIGIYAKKNIPEGAKIIEYVGEKVTKKESDRRALLPLDQNADNEEMGAVYLFTLTSRHDIDGYVPWNTARYINHSCSPNAESEILKGKIWIMAIRPICKGEEISYNYNYDWEDYEDHECYCGSRNCMGYILGEEYWPKLERKRERDRKKRAEARKKTAKKKAKKATKAKKRKSVKKGKK